MPGIPIQGRGLVQPGRALAAGRVKTVDSVADQIQWHILRSSLSIATAQAANSHFFTQRTQTAVAGNVESEGILPAPQWMKVVGVTAHFTPGAAVAGGTLVLPIDIAEFVNRSYLFVEINQTKIIDGWSLAHVPSGGGFTSTGTTTAATTTGTSGVPSPNDIYWLPVDFTIKGQESVKVWLEYEQALVLSATTRIHLSFHGERAFRAMSQ